MSFEIGEGLVGAYLRHVVGCPIVIYNSFTSGQGEIDVIGIRAEPETEVILCEVTTHMSGMQIARNGTDATERVVRDKLGRLEDFAARTFPNHIHTFQWWSPVVRRGLCESFELLEVEYKSRGVSLEFVLNEDFTGRINSLAECARTNASTTGEPSFRMLQILTRLRGDLRI